MSMQRNLVASVIVLGCWLAAGCSDLPGDDRAAAPVAQPTASAAGRAGDDRGTAAASSGRDGGQGSGSAAGAPVGEGGGAGGRIGTPIAIAPFDNVGGDLSGFLAAVQDRVRNQCDGDPGCFRVRIVYDPDDLREEPCTVVSIVPRRPRNYGDTVTATVTCEPASSSSEPFSEEGTAGESAGESTASDVQPGAADEGPSE